MNVVQTITRPFDRNKADKTAKQNIMYFPNLHALFIHMLLVRVQASVRLLMGFSITIIMYSVTH